MGGPHPHKQSVTHEYLSATCRQAQLERLWVGTFMTSLNMHGLSLTLLRLDDQLLQLLDAPAKARAPHALLSSMILPVDYGCIYGYRNGLLRQGSHKVFNE